MLGPPLTNLQAMPDDNTLKLTRRGPFWVGHFRAMASPCEIQVDQRSGKQVRKLIEAGYQEALRIERVFSRYRDDNIVYRINSSDGKPVQVDEEMARMLDFAALCYELSNGLFDITSGVLRDVWRFDASAKVPDTKLVEDCLARIGWSRVSWSTPTFVLPTGMEIDFGGIAKEYAVDRALAVMAELSDQPMLVNFGGDLNASKPPSSAEAWSVGIESVHQGRSSIRTLALYRGALTTSGDAHRFLIKDGQRYGHVLNPLTGWPVENAPSSVTVAGDNCTQAGILSTLALLHGEKAEAYLNEQGVTYWIQRA